MQELLLRKTQSDLWWYKVIVQQTGKSNISRERFKRKGAHMILETITYTETSNTLKRFNL